MNPDYTSTPPVSEQLPTRESLVDVLTDRPVVRLPNLVRDEFCNRCDEKNSVRMKYDLPRRDPSFGDGERVILAATFDVISFEDGWVVTAMYHADHPMKDKGEVSHPEHSQAQVTARLDRTGWEYTQPPIGDDGEPEEVFVEDRAVVRDVEIEWFSPVGEGEEREPIREPNEHGVIELQPTDPRPDWPDEENAWRRELMQENDDWNDEIPTVHFGEKRPTTPDEPRI